MDDLEAVYGPDFLTQIALFDYLAALFWQAVNGEKEAIVAVRCWLAPVNRVSGKPG